MIYYGIKISVEIESVPVDWPMDLDEQNGRNEDGQMKLCMVLLFVPFSNIIYISNKTNLCVIFVFSHIADQDDMQVEIVNKKQHLSTNGWKTYMWFTGM